jgi:hypothetical protein
LVPHRSHLCVERLPEGRGGYQHINVSLLGRAESGTTFDTTRQTSTERRVFALHRQPLVVRHHGVNRRSPFGPSLPVTPIPRPVPPVPPVLQPQILCRVRSGRSDRIPHRRRVLVERIARWLRAVLGVGRRSGRLR